MQAASRGWPLLGDAHYESPVEFGPRFEDVRLRAIALHARRLGFVNPDTQLPVSVDAPLPSVWQQYELEEETGGSTATA